MLKKTIITLILAFLTLNLYAQALVPDRYVTLTVDLDYKYLFHNGTTTYFVGYTANLDYHTGRLSAGLGFDNGLQANPSMADYDVWMNAHAGYAFPAGKNILTPYAATGWYFECYQSSTKNHDYLLSSVGCRFDSPLTDYAFLNLDTAFLLDSKLRYGFEISMGIRFKF